ncbi:MAG: peptidylprolyl isomerase [Alphaproteobacteria bacterium]
MPVRFRFLVLAFCVAAFASQPAPETAAQGAKTAALKPSAADAKNESGTSRGAVAMVNDAVISDYDLNQRMSLYLATAGVRPTAEQAKRIREQILRALVDEALQLQAAQKASITVAKEEVDKAMESIAKQNNTTVAQIEQVLGGVGVSINTLHTQLTIEIAWQKLMQSQQSIRIQISDEDVTAELQRLEEGARKPLFLVSEIFSAVDAPTDDDKIRTNMAQLAQQLNAGATFSAAARQFSQSPSAANGGDIGWAQQGQLAPEIDKALATMKRGEIAGPIRVAGGYYLLQLRDRREPAGTAVPQEQTQQKGITGPVSLARLLLALPPKSKEELKQNAMKFARDLRARVDSCPKLQQIAKQIEGSSFMNLGTMRPTQMSPDLRRALENTLPGEVAEPFLSSAGVEIIARCEPKVEKIVAFQIPSRDEIETRLFQERMSIMARRYLRDLRRDAVVEYK